MKTSEKRMRVASYMRVSTAEQTVASQRKILEAWVTRKGATPRWFVDRVSGVAATRPRLEALLAACRAKQVDAVVATRLDRLGRSMPHLLALVGELDRLGIRLVLVEQALDTRTAAGRLMLSVLGAVAEFERALIVERTKAGMAAARARGARPGRRPSLIGPQQARGRALIGAGEPIARVARTLGVSRTAVRRALEGPTDRE